MTKISNNNRDSRDWVGTQHLPIYCHNKQNYHFTTGDPINLPDGIYLSFPGWFVVQNGLVSTEGQDIYTLYGEKLQAENIVNNVVFHINLRRKIKNK